MSADANTLTYRALRGTARLAAHWFYRDVVFDGAERIPDAGPILLVVNHPNELMDAIFAGLVTPRQLTFTGKATLFANPLVAAFLRHMRVVPLRRVADERAKATAMSADEAAPEPAAVDATRNADAFAAIHAALTARQAVLIFPEGRSWDEPRLAPIKTGTARIALSAREAGVTGVMIVPVGINYELKHALRSRVLVEVGLPIDIDGLAPQEQDVDALTALIAQRLHAVTLNFGDAEDAAAVLDAATVLAAAGADEIRPLDDADTPIAAKVSVARQADAIRQRLGRGELTPALREQVLRVQRHLLSLQRTATTLGIRLDDVTLDTRLTTAGRFVLRELLLAAVGVPLAAWGRLNHQLPFSLTRWLGRRTASARSNVAMNTVVLGLLLVPLFYLLQTGLIWRVAGRWWALLYAAALVPSASWDLRYTERVRRLLMRARAWRHFRENPALQHRLHSELAALRIEAAGIAAGTPAL